VCVCVCGTTSLSTPLGSHTSFKEGTPGLSLSLTSAMFPQSHHGFPATWLSSHCPLFLTGNFPSVLLSGILPDLLSLPLAELWTHGGVWGLCSLTNLSPRVINSS
jgi:hypothetical protein